jgi:hypothetical protein
MLTVINLFVVDKIFNEVATKTLTVQAKMLYINCLTYHFKEKKPSIANAYAFEIFKNDVPNYKKYQPIFEELHKAELVIIREDAICFPNCWGKFIDYSLLKKVDPNTYVAGLQIQGVEAYSTEMVKSNSLKELCCMKHKISIRQVELLLELFVKEQLSIQKKYNGYTDCSKHFINWIPANIDKVPKEVVKSKNKLLGE